MAALVCTSSLLLGVALLGPLVVVVQLMVVGVFCSVVSVSGFLVFLCRTC